MKRYLNIACKNGKADSSKGLYRLPPFEKRSTRLYPFEDLQNVTYVIILNSFTRVCDAGIKSRLTGLDLHGSAIKWVVEFKFSIGRLFREMDLGTSTLINIKVYFQALHGQQSKTIFLFFCRNSRFILKMLDPDSHEMKTDFENCAGAVCRPPEPPNHLHGSQAGLCC